jgi:hypothetical protein
MALKTCYCILFYLRQVLVIIYQSCPEVDKLDVKVLGDHNVLRFQVPMNDSLGVEVGDGFKYLGKIKEHDLFFLLDKGKVLVDFDHEFKYVTVGTVIKDLGEVVFSFNSLMKPNNSRMAEFPKNQ